MARVGFGWVWVWGDDGMTLREVGDGAEDLGEELVVAGLEEGQGVGLVFGVVVVVVVGILIDDRLGLQVEAGRSWRRHDYETLVSIA